MKNIYFTISMLVFSILCYGAESSNNKNENFLPSEQLVCFPVDFFYATNTTFNSTDIGWNPTPDAIEYVVNYKRLDDTTWYAVSVADDSLASIYALDTCSGYEFYITTICNDFSELESLSDTFYTLCDTIVSSIITNAYSSNLIIYPNPASSEFNIQLNEPAFGAVEVKIYNSSGILEHNLEYFLNGETELNNLYSNKFNQGIKYISVMYNGKRFIKQLFIAR